MPTAAAREASDKENKHHAGCLRSMKKQDSDLALLKQAKSLTVCAIVLLACTRKPAQCRSPLRSTRGQAWSSTIWLQKIPFAVEMSAAQWLGSQRGRAWRLTCPLRWLGVEPMPRIDSWR